MKQAPSVIALADMEAGPPSGTLLAHIADLPEHGGKEVIFTDGPFRTSVFIQKMDENIGVFINQCPHAGTPLNMFGDKFLNLSGKKIICRTHGALFDPITGQCVRGPCKGDYLRPVAFRIEGGAIIST